MLSVAERIMKARISLSLRQPYLASALMRLPIVEARGGCPTFATDGFTLFYCERYAQRLDDAELRGVLAHELMHVVLDSAGRRQDRSHALWNVATDYVINGILTQCGFTLPKGGLLSSRFSLMTAEQVYEELLDRKGGRAIEEFIASDSLPVLQKEQEGDGRSGRLPEVSAPLVERSANPALALASEEPDAEQKEAILRGIRLEIASASGCGSLPGRLQEELAAASRPRVDWTGLLRQWLTDRVRIDWSTFPPSKRWLWQGIHLPSVGVPQPCRLVMIIDTSGSMPSGVLSRVMAEIAAFREHFPTPFTVIQSDTRIRSVREYGLFEAPGDEDFRRVLGRGGTDFRPPFAWVEENAAAEERTAVIHVTDGFGTWPDSASFPVLWMVPQDTPSTRSFPEYGDVVRI